MRAKSPRNDRLTNAPYAIPHVRLTPSIRNNELEIDEVVRALRDTA
jgi:hypothetical protein